jgi:hypothetical protein
MKKGAGTSVALRLVGESPWQVRVSVSRPVRAQAGAGLLRVRLRAQKWQRAWLPDNDLAHGRGQEGQPANKKAPLPRSVWRMVGPLL